jgi:hypothetical protein
VHHNFDTNTPDKAFHHGQLGALLKSHHNSVRDPDNELVHLYEIRDALSARFGGDRPTRAALQINGADWSCLGQLCNDDTGAIRPVS